MLETNPYAASIGRSDGTRGSRDWLPLVSRSISFFVGVSVASCVAVCTILGLSAGWQSIQSEPLGFVAICVQFLVGALVTAGSYAILRSNIVPTRLPKPVVSLVSGTVFVAVACCSHFGLAKLLPDILASYLRNTLPSLIDIDIALAIPAGLIAAIACVELSQLLCRRVQTDTTGQQHDVFVR